MNQTPITGNCLVSVLNLPAKKKIGGAYLYEPAHRACEALCEFPEGYRVMRWRLIPGHYLRSPLAVTRPLKGL
jgi:hypothetical protein